MNKYWELKDGNIKMIRTARYPEVEKTSNHTIDGLTLSSTVTKSFTFTVEQLKRAATADKLVGVSFTREQIKDLIISIFKENRWELFGSCISPYKITFNGYGQLKSAECEGTGIKLNVNQIFNILEDIYLTRDVA